MHYFQNMSFAWLGFKTLTGAAAVNLACGLPSLRPPYLLTPGKNPAYAHGAAFAFLPDTALCEKDIDSPRSKRCEGESTSVSQGCRIDSWELNCDGRAQGTGLCFLMTQFSYILLSNNMHLRTCTDARPSFQLPILHKFHEIFEKFQSCFLKFLTKLTTLHHITLHYKTIYSGQSKKLQGPLWRSHTTMSGYDCRNKCVFSFRRNDNSDVAEVTSRGRVFQILGPAVANWAVTNSNAARWANIKKTGRRWPKTGSGWHVSNVTKLFGQQYHISQGQLQKKPADHNCWVELSNV